MKSIIITTLLAAAVMATPDFKTTTKEPTPTPPVCKFDPVKGEYVCPEGTNTADTLSHTSFHTATADAPAADCAKCQADWEKCLTHWGCWFYNCGPACHCQVANKDPQCKECPAGECHA
jgi:predicted nucleic acid-binding Zn ribbon protein